MSERILITGATSGIGRALAARLCNGNTVLATGSRPAGQVASLLPETVQYVQADQTSPVDAAKTVSAALDRCGWTGLDLAVLNAGIGFAQSPPDETIEAIRQTIDVNLMSPILMARSLADRLESASGKLVIIGSVAHRGAPGFATYAASKAGLHGFARALREEWRDRIRVQVIHPGPTATPMHARAGFDPGRIGHFFLKPDTMAALVHRAMASDRSPVNTSFARYLFSGAFARRAG
jgi:NAD(P)-dependent dehydrogenase (short-subunit alcohol dehydrogenase family)